MRTTRTQRRAREGRPRLFILAVVFAAAGAGFAAQYFSNRSKAAQLAAEQAAWEAPAAGKSAGLAMPEARPAPKPVAPAVAKSSAAAQAAPLSSWVPAQKIFQDMIAAPTDFLVRRTNLGDPRKLRAFLKDRQRTRRYLGHPLIRGVLDDPALVRRLAGNPVLVRAFLKSPAMQDSAAVSALAESGFLDEILKSPGVSALVDDPEFVRRVLVNSDTAAWAAKHPEALPALSKIGWPRAGAVP